VAEGYGNVTAESLAEANNLESPELILRVGESLALPEDAYGTAPPDALNPGTACLEYTVPASVFDEIINGAAATPTPPAEVSNQVTIEANANDWVVNADGQTSAPNEGVVSVRRGTRISFGSKVGLHTVTLNGEQEGDDINAGESIEVTFDEPGQFKITCDYHPDMLAWVFVEE
jgi:plastocyanin